MATDATGAPTSLGIPKIDPDVDAPSGLGTNAAMDSINTLLGARVDKPAGIVSGEVPVWNGSTWVRSTTTNVGPSSLGSGSPDATKFLRGDGAWSVATQGPNKITTSTMAGGPPGSPTDGDIWIATAVDANGTRWAFQYNAGSASTYKWEFVGGPPVRVGINTGETLTTTGVQNTATVGPDVTVARAGDYQAEFACAIYRSNAPATDHIQTGVCIANGSFAGDIISDHVTAVGTSITLSGSTVILAVPAASVLRQRYNSPTANCTIASARVVCVTPVRVI